MTSKAVESIVGFIFILFVMIVIAFVAYGFLAQFLESTPELSALIDTKTAIETVCKPDGPSFMDFSTNLPAGRKLQMTVGGTLELHNSGVVSKTLDCPSRTLFLECYAGPTLQGRESISFGIIKEQNTIRFNDTAGSGRINCVV